MNKIKPEKRFVLTKDFKRGIINMKKGERGNTYGEDSYFINIQFDCQNSLYAIPKHEFIDYADIY